MLRFFLTHSSLFIDDIIGVKHNAYTTFQTTVRKSGIQTLDYELSNINDFWWVSL